LADVIKARVIVKTKHRRPATFQRKRALRQECCWWMQLTSLYRYLAGEPCTCAQAAQSWTYRLAKAHTTTGLSVGGGSNAPSAR